MILRRIFATFVAASLLNLTTAGTDPNCGSSHASDRTSSHAPTDQGAAHAGGHHGKTHDSQPSGPDHPSHHAITCCQLLPCSLVLNAGSAVDAVARAVVATSTHASRIMVWTPPANGPEPPPPRV